MCSVLKRKATYDSRDRQKRLTSGAYDRWSLVWDVAGYTNRVIYDAALKLLDERHKTLLRRGGFARIEVKLVHYWIKTFAILAE